MINFLHTFEPSAVAFTLGSLAVHWYGLFIVSGMVAGLLVAARLAERIGVKRDEVYNLAFYLIIFSLLGARIYAVLLELPYYLANPLEIVAIWRGGLAIHGGLIGGGLTLFFYARKKQQSFWQWADILTTVVPLGQAIGRWGNYFNQELFGTPTDLPWGIPISPANRPSAFQSATYFHPTFLYESILNAINFIILIALFKKRERSKLKSGSIALVYLINYSLIRIAMELLRTDETPLLSGVRWPIVVSIIVIIAAGAGLYFTQRQRKTFVDSDRTS